MGSHAPDCQCASCICDRVQRLEKQVKRLEQAGHKALDALLSAKAFIRAKYGSTNPARDEAIAELRKVLDRPDTTDAAG